MNLGPVFNWKSPLSTQCFSGFFSHTQKNNNVKETFFDKKPLKNKDIEDEYFLGKYYKIKVFFSPKTMSPGSGFMPTNYLIFY